MINQWVKVVRGDCNIQTCWPVKHGGPDMNGDYTLIAHHLHKRLNRDGINPPPYDFVISETVELLGLERIRPKWGEAVDIVSRL